LAIEAEALAIGSDQVPSVVLVFARATVDQSLCTLTAIFAIGFTDWAIAFEIQESLGGCGIAARECSAEGGSHALALAAVGAYSWCVAFGWLGLGRVFGWGLGMGSPWGVMRSGAQ